MKIDLFEFEKNIHLRIGESNMPLSDEEINLKYEKGHARIVTEQGAYKLPLLKDIFKQGNYKLRPDFQRRITWDTQKRSKLIESFIMNIPVPPVFIYEHDFDKYEVMDGLQRISTIIDFYEDRFALEGLEEWSELNRKKYSELPEKIKEGIDRRQLPSITLLKESAKSIIQAQEMKKMVFERLNTGGEKLKDQEIRNALYDGKFNKLCIILSENASFRNLWGIKVDTFIEDEENVQFDDEAITLANNKLYRRMYDVELVLRFFAMRHIDKFNMSLNLFLDECLKVGNSYTDEEINELKQLFTDTISKADLLFGDKAFCQFAKIRGGLKWSLPQRMIYDPMMLALSHRDIVISKESNNQEQNIEKLISFYQEFDELFNGKKQSKADIQIRAGRLEDLIRNIIK